MSNISKTVTVSKMGNSSLYVILPKKLMERFNIDIKEGDNVLFEVDNGSLKLTKVKMIKE